MHDNGLKGECADPVEDIPVAELIIHESYQPSSNSRAHDIALIRLQRAVPIKDYTRPICLPILDLQNKNYGRSALTIAGFGRTLTGMYESNQLY